MTFTVAEIADALGVDFAGDGATRIVRAAEPGAASDRDLAVATSPKFAEALVQGRAKAAQVYPRLFGERLCEGTASQKRFDLLGLQARPVLSLSRRDEPRDQGQELGTGRLPERGST